MTDDAAILIINDSETDSDLYYATRFHVGGPIPYVQLNGKSYLLVNDLEYGRAGSEARVGEVISTTHYEEKLRSKDEPVSLVGVVDLFLQEHGCRRLQVPASLAFGYAEGLRKAGYELEIKPDPFIPERTVKTTEEIRYIETMQEHAEEAMGLAVELLKQSKVHDGQLWINGSPLTSEHVRVEMQKLLLERGCEASLIIVAGGDQAADPHQRGFGPLPASQTIIIDVFPRSLENHYWGDMTRTFVRGHATAEAKKLFDDVLVAQERALSLIRDGVNGQDVHNAVVESFQKSGNENGEKNGKKVGFIHTTGHGVGLDIHELPRLGRQPSPLEAGHVVTVEPGLYYPGVGSVRLEDLVVVTEDGCRNLNRFPKELEI